jgi:Rrf2 family transcriptional regulator, iron-sulfur cluster assembly transcription factor
VKVSAQEEYGLRCLLQLARLEEGEFLTLGTKGGYRLARPASEIRLSEIIKVQDEDVLESHCKTYAGLLDSCVHTGNCGIRPVIAGLHDVVRQALSGITLAQLLGTESKVESVLYEIHALPRHGAHGKRA